MIRAPLLLALLGLTGSFAPPAEPATTQIAIDAGAERHPISPLIYGASFADADAIADLNLPLVRAGGNSASAYNWRAEARGAGRDWYFESMAIAPDDASQYGTRFVARARGAAALVTVPMLGWVARLGAGGGKLPGFSVAKYGWQQASEGDAGNGLRTDGSRVAGNDPHDAAQPDTIADQRAWVQSLVARWGSAARGGVQFYAMDNEPSRWHDIHRDVHPVGLHATELAQRVLDYAQMVKSVDPSAKVLAPEEWGWNGYRYSGFDQQIGDAHGYHALPDRRDQTGDLDLLPWLLGRLKQSGHPIDIISVHYYPQGGEYREHGDDVSPAMQRLRNRSTRSLWDPDYVDASWIDDRVALIPRLRGWASDYYYPGTPLAITEYNWGAERHMNGATAQADVLGIFGREGLYLAARWATPAKGSPAYLAMKLFRNADGAHHGFGETSVAARAPDPDRVASFAALRGDGALTVVAINKQLDRPAPVSIALSRFGASGSISGVRLAAGRLAPLDATRYRGAAVPAVLPPQSVTLYVLTPDAR